MRLVVMPGNLYDMSMAGGRAQHTRDSRGRVCLLKGQLFYHRRVMVEGREVMESCGPAEGPFDEPHMARLKKRAQKKADKWERDRGEAGGEAVLVVSEGPRSGRRRQLIDNQRADVVSSPVAE